MHIRSSIIITLIFDINIKNRYNKICVGGRARRRAAGGGARASLIVSHRR